MEEETVDRWALDEVHFQQPGSRCRMWVPPEIKDPIVYHHPTRKSVGYFGAVRLRDGKFLFRRETGRFNGENPPAIMRNYFKTLCLAPIADSMIDRIRARLLPAWFRARRQTSHKPSRRARHGGRGNGARAAGANKQRQRPMGTFPPQIE